MNAGSGSPWFKPTPATSSGASILRWLRAIRTTSMPRWVRSLQQQHRLRQRNGCQIGVWSSTDGGDTWAFMAGSAGGSLRNCTNGQGDYPQNWYDQAVAVDPNNPDRVFISTFDVWFATRTGTTFNDTTCGYSYSGNAGPVHVDQHALAFLPGSSSILAIGNDGGIHGTINADVVSSTVDPTWFNMDTGLNTIEFYSGDISGNFANAPAPVAVGGAQDNGPSSVTFAGTPTGPVLWQLGSGGDGFSGQIDPRGTTCTQAQGTDHCVWRGNGWPNICGRDANVHLGSDQGWCWPGFSRHKCELTRQPTSATAINADIPSQVTAGGQWFERCCHRRCLRQRREFDSFFQYQQRELDI